MSKLDDILHAVAERAYTEYEHGDKYGIQVHEGKDQVKDLMLELIGEDISLDGDAYGIHEAQNDLRYDLRKKVEEL